MFWLCVLVFVLVFALVFGLCFCWILFFLNRCSKVFVFWLSIECLCSFFQRVLYIVVVTVSSFKIL